jgi:hypothetical protein
MIRCLGNIVRRRRLKYLVKRRGEEKEEERVEQGRVQRARPTLGVEEEGIGLYSPFCR